MLELYILHTRNSEMSETEVSTTSSITFTRKYCVYELFFHEYLEVFVCMLKGHI